MNGLRHIAKLVNTDTRCVVVFMQIPNRENHALVVSTDHLNPRFEEALMNVVKSPEGQNDPVLANVLNRRLMPDSGQNMLTALHEGNLLRAVHVDQVLMMPVPNQAIPLRTVIELMGGRAPELSQEHPVITEDKYNPHVQNAQAMDAENRVGVSRNLIIEAEMLESEARAKRERAYLLNPDLRPQAQMIPVAAPLPATKVLIEAETVIAKPKRAPRKPKATKTA